MPPPREFRGPWHVVREEWPRHTAQEAVNRPPLIRTEEQHEADEERERRERARRAEEQRAQSYREQIRATTMTQFATLVKQPGKQSKSGLSSGLRGRDSQL